MKKGIIGKKIGMTQVFDEMGNVIPVTVIQAGPCTVVQKKTVEALGLRKLHHSVELEDSPATRGAINKVSHLLKVEEL